MLVRVIVLFFGIAALAYAGITLRKNVTPSQWKLAGGVTVKLLVCAAFAATVIAGFSIVSQLSN